MLTCPLSCWRCTRAERDLPSPFCWKCDRFLSGKNYDEIRALNPTPAQLAVLQDFSIATLSELISSRDLPTADMRPFEFHKLQASAKALLPKLLAKRRRAKAYRTKRRLQELLRKAEIRPEEWTTAA